MTDFFVRACAPIISIARVLDNVTMHTPALLALLLSRALAGPPPAPTLSPAARNRTIAVIGAGFSGLAAACELRLLGYDVVVFDNHAEVGGRAQRVERADGFAWDQGPSWYWMPRTFDDIFARFGSSRAAHYNLTRLDPAYRLVFGPGDALDVPGTLPGFLAMAAALDPGADAAGFFADGEVKMAAGDEA